MTIALAIKVNDGFVLAADSATTLANVDINGNFRVTNIYNNANKIVNLHKDLPVGLMTWGLGNIGPSSIATLAKDLRVRFEGRDSDNVEWRLDPDTYSIPAVAQRVREFFYEEEYLSPASEATGSPHALGLLVGGYSAHGHLAEAYTLSMAGGQCSGPTEVLDEGAGAVWFGQPEAITRLLLGVSGSLEQALLLLGVEATEAPLYVEAIKNEIALPFVSDAMPVQDAIDLADFLVDTTVKFVRFAPGSETVGGPTEIAAITKHEGFKWIKRKHYYQAALNP